MNDAPENIGVLFTASGLYKHARVTNEYFGLTNAGVGYTRTDIADARATQARADGFNEALKAAAEIAEKSTYHSKDCDQYCVYGCPTHTDVEAAILALQSSDAAPAQVGVEITTETLYEGEAGLSAILTVTLLAQLIFWAAVIAEWKGWI